MDTLESMRAFARVVELGGFSAAARALSLSPAMVTKHVAHLERRVAARLLERTTRHVRPTEVGAAYYARCVDLLAAIDEAENAAGAQTLEPLGTLRVTAPAEFGNLHLAGVCAEFMRRHAGVTLLLDFGNRVADLVEEGYDAAVRVAPALDSSLAGRQLCASRMHVVASPAFLSERRRVRSPRELAALPALCFAVPSVRDEWRYTAGRRRGSVRVKPRLIATSSEALLRAALSGAGVSWLPSFVCGAELRAGRLVSLLPQFDFGTLNVYAVYPHRSFLPAKVRSFVDFLVERLGPDPRADPWSP